MDEHKHHVEILHSFFHEQQQIFDASGQAIYAFLDDGCIVCNKKFATLLGYSSPEEWAKVPETFTEAFVAPNSRATLVNAYRNAMESMVGSTIQISWKKKSGGTVDANVMLVPICHQGHVFAFHFISQH